MRLAGVCDRLMGIRWVKLSHVIDLWALAGWYGQYYAGSLLFPMKFLSVPILACLDLTVLAIFFFNPHCCVFDARRCGAAWRQMVALVSLAAVTLQLKTTPIRLYRIIGGWCWQCRDLNLWPVGRERTVLDNYAIWTPAYKRAYNHCWFRASKQTWGIDW